MEGNPNFNVFIGAETGILKGVNALKKQWTNLHSTHEANKDKEILSMCWGDEQQSTICAALRNGCVLEYDSVSGELTTNEDMIPADQASIRGIAKYNGCYVTCTDTGNLSLWRDGEEPVVVKAGGSLKAMAQHPVDSHLFATGGEENDLKLWDLNQPAEAIFKAKNVKNDFLNLRVPVCVNAVDFFKHNNTIVTGTGHHQVRVYDPNCSQRRPVLDMEYDDCPIVSLSVVPGKQEVIVGNAKGNMATLDLRMKGLLSRAFKGVAGSVRSVQCHAAKDVVASCGLDRHLRIHQISTGKLMAKFYLKSRLNCLLFADEWPTEEAAAAAGGAAAAETPAAAENDSGHCSAEDEQQDVWEDMDEVDPKKRKAEEEEDATVEKKMKKKKIKKKRTA